jgi:L-rhamnose mutarotase
METETVAFVLKMRPGKAEEYEKRHDEPWPEMKALLLGAGILHYEIYLERETNYLFGHIVRRKDHTMDTIADHPVSRRWQEFMRDVLEQEESRSFRRPLQRVFLLEA